MIEAGGETANVLNHIEMTDETGGKKEAGAEIMGTPAIANGAIFIQTVNALYCVSAKK